MKYLSSSFHRQRMKISYKMFSQTKEKGIATCLRFGYKRVTRDKTISLLEVLDDSKDVSSSFAV